jgi:hypothetical protein
VSEGAKKKIENKKIGGKKKSWDGRIKFGEKDEISCFGALPRSRKK